jgi:hypothetical protein
LIYPLPKGNGNEEPIGRILERKYYKSVYTAMLYWFISRFILYCALPLFVFLLVLTLGMKDFERRPAMRDFLKNTIRKFF